MILRRPTGSLVVLPVLVLTLVLARNLDRTIHWTNLVAAVWLLTALFPRFNVGTSPFPVSMSDAFLWMGRLWMLMLATF